MRKDKLGKDQFKKQVGHPAKEYDLHPEKPQRGKLMVCFSPKQSNDVIRISAWQDKAEGFNCEVE